MPSGLPPKYPPGSILRCPCGREGPSRNVGIHFTSSKKHACHPTPDHRPEVIGGPDPILPDHATLDAVEATDVMTEAIEVAADIAQEPLSSAPSADPQPSDIPVYTDRLPSPPPATPTSPQRHPSPPAELRPARERQGEWREPSTVKGPTGMKPGMIRSVFDLPIETHALYEFVRANPKYAFEGTMSDFLASVVAGYFRILRKKAGIFDLPPDGVS